MCFTHILKNVNINLQPDSCFLKNKNIYISNLPKYLQLEHLSTHSTFLTQEKVLDALIHITSLGLKAVSSFRVSGKSSGLASTKLWNLFCVAGRDLMGVEFQKRGGGGCESVHLDSSTFNTMLSTLSEKPLNHKAVEAGRVFWRITTVCFPWSFYSFSRHPLVATVRERILD